MNKLLMLSLGIFMIASFIQLDFIAIGLISFTALCLFATLKSLLNIPNSGTDPIKRQRAMKSFIYFGFASLLFGLLLSIYLIINYLKLFITTVIFVTVLSLVLKNFSKYKK